MNSFEAIEQYKVIRTTFDLTQFYPVDVLKNLRFRPDTRVLRNYAMFHVHSEFRSLLKSVQALEEFPNIIDNSVLYKDSAEGVESLHITIYVPKFAKVNDDVPTLVCISTRYLEEPDLLRIVKHRYGDEIALSRERGVRAYERDQYWRKHRIYFMI